MHAKVPRFKKLGVNCGVYDVWGPGVGKTKGKILRGAGGEIIPKKGLLGRYYACELKLGKEIQKIMGKTLNNLGFSKKTPPLHNPKQCIK
ncbi:MAG: hypothetical protein CM15mP13_1200 [Pseudomonadota bacterium]|nr:MAG: hypothetical protein CM15mP13_1200 [Pseudomonadota bacterium]